MKTFDYKALDKKGKEVSGTIKAENITMAVRELIDQEYFPTSISELVNKDKERRLETFDYKALDKKGKEVSGTIKAENTTDVLNELKDKGYFPTSVVDSKEKDIVDKGVTASIIKITGLSGDETKINIENNTESQLVFFNLVKWIKEQKEKGDFEKVEVDGTIL